MKEIKELILSMQNDLRCIGVKCLKDDDKSIEDIDNII